MLSAHGFTVQLFLSSQTLEPYFKSTLNAGATAASYAAPLQAGDSWLVAWKDDRPAEHGKSSGTVGTVFVREGEGGSEDMVGSATFDARADKYPTVEGVLKSSRSLFRVTLVIKQGSLVARHPTPLAVFTLNLTVEDSHLLSTLSSALNIGLTASSPPYRSSSPVKEEDDVKPSASSSTMIHISSAEYADFLKLKKELEAAKNAASYFGDSVESLYRALPLPERVAYLDRRLRTEALSPSMRASIATSKYDTLQELEARRQDAANVQLQKLLAEVIKHGQAEETGAE
ncbi:hypothetical protein JCM11641_005512 [Rhodosporidiobolus odoratus]